MTGQRTGDQGDRRGEAATPSARSDRAYWLAWAATLLFFGGFYALLVPLPLYLASVGLADWQIGLVLGAFGVASLLGRSLAGVAADRWGPRAVLLAGAGALLAGAVGVGLTRDMLALGGLRLLQAIGYVAFTTAGTGLVIALTPAAERGRRLAIFGAAANVAITLTPAAVSALLAVAPLTSGFWAAGGLALLAGGLAACIAAPRRAAADRPGWAAAWRVPRQLALPMLAAGLHGAGFAAFFQFAPLLAERRSAPAGLLYTVYGIGIILARIAGGRWLDRVGIGPAALVAALLMMAGLGLAAVAATPLGLGLAAALVASGSGLSHPALLAHHARLLPGAPGRASAGFYLGFDLGIGLGSWLVGAALQVAGLAGLYGAAALLVALSLPLIPALARQARPAPAAATAGD
jgi:predicted MFS family arabinose efflux permease